MSRPVESETKNPGIIEAEWISTYDEDHISRIKGFFRGVRHPIVEETILSAKQILQEETEE